MNDQNTPSSSCPNGRHGGWLQSCIIRIATTCARRSAVVVAIALAIGAVAAWYANRHIAIDTDTAKLIASDVPWRQREIAFDAAFPQRLDLIAVVVDAPTAEVAERSTAALTAALSRNTELFRSVRRPDAGPFFEREGLLFMPLNELDAALERVIAAQPLLAVVAADPTLHGLVSALRLMLEGARRDPAAWMSLAQPMSALADAFDAPLAGAPKLFSWRALLNGGSVDARELRRFILAQPVLDYGELQPGAKATKFIRATARDLGLTGERGVRVRLTGPVPLADEELATLRDGAAFDAALTGMAVLVLLWLAFRSSRVVCAVLLTLMVGLAITTALGLLVYDRFNLISVAFAVLFIGLGVDFGIQFCVAYRAQREHAADPAAAVAAAARNIGPSLALAAMSTALGFYAFAPTAYRGLAELGFIAGTGMLVAFATNITLLPALLSIMGVRPGTMPIANPRLTALDGLLARRRSWVVAVAIVLALLSIALIPRLVFDFNPLNLRSRSSESVDTLLDLARDPLTTPNTIDVLTPSLASAVALGERLARLPEVDHVVTLASFVPDDQPQKLAAIADAALLLDPVLNAESNVAPDDARTVQALGAAARALDDARSYAPPPVAAPLARLGAALKHLAQRTPAERERASEMLMPGFRVVVDQLRAALGADPVTLQTLPADLIRDWVGADGRARVEVYPRGDVNDNAALARFVDAVRRIAPDASGASVSIAESRRTIVHAFVQAGAWALLAIALLLALFLRDVASVLLALAPVMLAGLLTLGISALTGLALNFENIIALPLLLGIGVAFDIYFIMAWRSGRAYLLASSLTRAVLFSALTTGTAFGSLWLSRHPGTASMGKLLVISLVCILAMVLVVLPALLRMVRPRAMRQSSA